MEVHFQSITEKLEETDLVFLLNIGGWKLVCKFVKKADTIYKTGTTAEENSFPVTTKFGSVTQCSTLSALRTNENCKIFITCSKVRCEIGPSHQLKRSVLFRCISRVCLNGSLHKIKFSIKKTLFNFHSFILTNSRDLLTNKQETMSVSQCQVEPLLMKLDLSSLKASQKITTTN